MLDSSAASKLKIFISYSRADCSAFAQDLLLGLELLNFDPFLDLHDIAAGEDWEARLSGLIQAADTVVFVISPQAVKSERCAWEVAKSIGDSKRLIPIVALPVAEADVPQSLKRLNYIFFHEPHTFARALGQLAQALKADLNWVREHTRLGELAARWQERERLDALLLRGSELEAAQAWIAQWKPGAPEPTDTQRSFITLSADSEAARANRERQQLEEMATAQSARAQALAEREAVVKTLSRRTTVGLIGAGTLTAVAAGLAYWGVDAERRFNSERAKAEEADRNSIAQAIVRESMRTDIEGQLVAYAASPGQEALDGSGKHSPYTEAVLAELEDPNLPLQSALARAKKKVLAASSDRQRPYTSTDLNGEIYLSKQPADRRRKAISISVSECCSGITLANAKNDADAWEHQFNKAGFETVRLVNPTREEFNAAVDKLSFEEPQKHGSSPPSLIHRIGLKPIEKIAGSSNTLVFLFFAGVGISIKGVDQLMFADTKADSEASVEAGTVKLFEIQEKFRQKAAASVMILDTNFNTVSFETKSEATSSR